MYIIQLIESPLTFYELIKSLIDLVATISWIRYEIENYVHYSAVKSMSMIPIWL